jgi:hypothetical protein
METTELCQSCGMPLQNIDEFGTEKDGSINSEYCINCYSEGSFTRPDATIDYMKEIVTNIMENLEMPSDEINKEVENLKNLKRWN